MNISQEQMGVFFGLTMPDRKYEFDGNGNLTYEGIYPPGKLTSDSVWIIERYFYTANQPTDSKIRRNISWDNRATIT